MKNRRHILALCTALIETPIALTATEQQSFEVVARQDVPQVKVRAGGISIELPGEEPQHVQIYALTGQVVKQFDAAPGQTVVDLPAGYYIVRVGSVTIKVAVK